MALTFPSHTPLRSTTEALAAALAACKPGAKVVDRDIRSASIDPRGDAGAGDAA